jgi:hypothetical protein
MLSGGYDSCVLLSLLLIKAQPTYVELYTIDKPDNSVINAHAITEVFRTLYPNVGFVNVIVKGGDYQEDCMIGTGGPWDAINHDTKWGPIGTQGYIALNDIIDKHAEDVDVIYSGYTKNPPCIINSTTSPPFRKNADKAQEKYPKFTGPFSHLTKDKIIMIACDIGAHHAMIMSHTCTQVPAGRCNECWQCKERAWAFDQNNMLDYGVN